MKPEYPQFIWGIGIDVRRCDGNLVVSGRRWFRLEQGAVAPDALRNYRMAFRHFGQKRQGKNSPHIQFANADSDQKLIKFVQQFGPVVVRSSKTEQRAACSDDPFGRTSLTTLVADQDLEELRNERDIYRNALVLVSELKRPNTTDIPTILSCVSAIAKRTATWPSQWKRERKLRSSGQGCLPEPPWFFDEENVRRIETFEFYATQEPSKEPLSISVLSANPVTCGHYVICELVNAFRPVVYVWGDTPVEAPEHDLTGGIRPVLYHILRREYLHAAGVGVCRNMQCLEVFDIERAGQEFCSELCSRRQRQREYWQERGKKVRQRRIRHQKRAVAGLGGDQSS